MPKNWTRIAATLMLVGLAMPANATEYGAWKLIDTKVVKEFSADATAPSDRFGRWDLIDVQYAKDFLPDVALAPVNRYGQWQLADVTFDRQWLADQFIRIDDLGSAEVGRILASDDVDKDKYLKDTGKKIFGDPSEKLLNPVQKEVILGQFKRRDSGRPVSTLVEQYRIDTIYDKEVSHPWTQTYTYAETEKHTRTYNVSVDHKRRLVFKDPITGQQSDEYTIDTEKHQDVNATGFQDNGKLTTVTDSGVVVDPLFKVTQEGSVRERELGKKAESAAAAASSQSASAVAISSNSQVGNNIRKVGYAGLEERKALAVDKVVLAKKVDKKDKSAEAEADAKEKAAAAASPKPAASPAPAVGQNNQNNKDHDKDHDKDQNNNGNKANPVVSHDVQNQLNELDGRNDWKDLGEALKAAKTKDDLIAIGLAILAGKGGDIKSTEAGMSEQQIRDRVAKLTDASDSSKAQFVADMFDVQKDTLTGRWGPNLEKFFNGKGLSDDSRMRFFQEIGMAPVISSNSGLDRWGNRTVVYTLKLGNVQLGYYTTSYNAYGW